MLSCDMNGFNGGGAGGGLALIMHSLAAHKATVARTYYLMRATHV